MSSIERLDSGTVDVPPLAVGAPVIDIIEPIFKSPLVLSEVIVIENVVVLIDPVTMVDVPVVELTAKPVIVTELPPLVSDIAMFPTDTLSLRLLKVVL